MIQKNKALALCLGLSLALASGAGLAAGKGEGKGNGNGNGGGMGGRSAGHAASGETNAKNTLGPLNAAHASATAFAHASPNSRVGRIAAYKQAAAIADATDADAGAQAFASLVAASGLAQAYADWQAGSITQADFEALLAASADDALLANK